MLVIGKADAQNQHIVHDDTITTGSGIIYRKSAWIEHALPNKEVEELLWTPSMTVESLEGHEESAFGFFQHYVAYRSAEADSVLAHINKAVDLLQESVRSSDLASQALEVQSIVRKRALSSTVKGGMVSVFYGVVDPAVNAAGAHSFKALMQLAQAAIESTDYGSAQAYIAALGDSEIQRSAYLALAEACLESRALEGMAHALEAAMRPAPNPYMNLALRRDVKVDPLADQRQYILIKMARELGFEQTLDSLRSIADEMTRADYLAELCTLCSQSLQNEDLARQLKLESNDSRSRGLHVLHLCRSMIHSLPDRGKFKLYHLENQLIESLMEADLFEDALDAISETEHEKSRDLQFVSLAIKCIRQDRFDLFEKAFAGISDSSERDHLASNYALTLIIPRGKLEESPAILEHSMLLISWIEAESTRDKLWSILGDKLMRSHSLGNSLDAFLRINDAQSRDEKLLRLVDQALQEGLQHLALDSAREIKDPATREKALAQARS